MDYRLQTKMRRCVEKSGFFVWYIKTLEQFGENGSSRTPFFGSARAVYFGVNELNNLFVDQLGTLLPAMLTFVV